MDNNTIGSNYSIGVDIGGTHISCAVIDTVEGKVLDSTYVKSCIDNSLNATSIIERWCLVIEKSIALGGKEIDGVGFAMPGPFDYPNGICEIAGVEKFSTLFGLNIGLAIRNCLKLPNTLPIRFVNDAFAFGIGESISKKEFHNTKALAVTLGTGFGSTFLDCCAPIESGDNVPTDGMLYHYPFLSGIADDYISTRWCIERYRELTGELVNGVKTIADRYNSDNSAASVLNEFSKNLGVILGKWVEIFGAEKILIGGSISGSLHLLKPILTETLGKQGLTPDIVKSTMGDMAAIIGASKLSDNNFYSKLLSNR